MDLKPLHTNLNCSHMDYWITLATLFTRLLLDNTFVFVLFVFFVVHKFDSYGAWKRDWPQKHGKGDAETRNPIYNACAISFVCLVSFVVIIKINHEGHKAHEEYRESITTKANGETANKFARSLFRRFFFVPLCLCGS